MVGLEMEPTQQLLPEQRGEEEGDEEETQLDCCSSSSLRSQLRAVGRSCGCAAVQGADPSRADLI